VPEAAAELRHRIELIEAKPGNTRHQANDGQNRSFDFGAKFVDNRSSLTLRFEGELIDATYLGKAHA